MRAKQKKKKKKLKDLQNESIQGKCENFKTHSIRSFKSEMFSKFYLNKKQAKHKKYKPGKKMVTMKKKVSAASQSSPEFQADVGSDLTSQSESDSDADQTSVTQDMLDSLISAIIQRLELKEDETSSQDVSVAFKRIKRPSRVFTNHKEFDNTTSTHPGKRFSGRKRLDVLYPFHSDLVSKWSESPKVDPPVSRLSFQTVLSILDAASLRDPTDRQIEALAKSAFEASGASFCPNFASLWVAKAVSAWAKTLRRGILASAPAEELSDLADQISLAGKYLMNASLDAAACSARANSSIVVIRRVLWLKAWNADPASKKSLTGLPFQGSRLFGTQLDQMISTLRVVRVPPYHSPSLNVPSTGGAPSPFIPFGPLPPQETPIRTALPHKETGGSLLSGLPRAGERRATPQNHLDLVATGFLINDGSPPPGNPSRVGDRLLLFSEVWLSVVDNAWVREIITSGYKIEFSSPQEDVSCSLVLPNSPPISQGFSRPSIHSSPQESWFWFLIASGFSFASLEDTDHGCMLLPIGG
ncbi:unnamed protein product [Ranitomeya imitator]|uniref:Lamina-associated polypeptide 2 alpha C-terminal domain-containing protein n=1 Tax=Ranitomeya imitator TaxID=111125 RepID=A0ABN9LLS1_9NEOB|nr:unnamed protein product [Ranitomeya imitator]